MKIAIEIHNKKKSTISAMETDRLPSWNLWREIADFYLPRRYIYLQTEKERKVKNAKNPFILDPTGTLAARTLASGMMNGITSPSRPWFTLRMPGFDDDSVSETRLWLDEVTRRLLLIMAESNFYNSMAVMYLDLVTFGTAASLIYEDSESVIRCYNPALGEYYLAQDSRLQVNTFARKFTYKVHQVVERWGEENCSTHVKDAFKAGGGRLQEDVSIVHLIEPNLGGKDAAPSRFPFVEWYWEESAPVGEILERKGYNEPPGLFPRWEITGNDAYGDGPAASALGDVIQLQQETKVKGKALWYQIEPPMVADVQLAHKPTATQPRGITYIRGNENVGMKPAYQIQFPFNEITLDIRDLQSRIRETFHNDLFQMISQLETVRSATEIDARREEKLVLLGSVLERFENEALDPAINRVFGIASRLGLLPPPPETIRGANIEVQYVSILSLAQRAVGAAPTERWLQLVANVAPIYPEGINIVDWDETIRSYGRDIGVPARNMRTPEATEAINTAQRQQVAAQQAAQTGDVLVNSAKALGETDVGGGANALQMLLGG